MPPISTTKSTTWLRNRVVAACGLAGACALVVILGLIIHLEKHRRAVLADLANESVQKHVRLARQHLDSQAWAQAVSELIEAQTTRDATEMAEIAPLLVKARKGQAEVLFDSALDAVNRQELARGKSLVNDYLDNPLASRNREAADLRAELDRATSDDLAAKLLASLSAEDLASYRERSLAGELATLHRDALREAYRETLERAIKREKRRRETEQMAHEENARKQRESDNQERERRLARIRATPVFRELTEYLALTRKQYMAFHPNQNSEDRRLLAELASDSNQRKGDDKTKLAQQLRQRLAGHTGAAVFARWKDDIELQISSRRAQFKERFRAYKGFDDTDARLFDMEVDEQLNPMLHQLREPVVDDFADGLKALLEGR